MKHSLAAIAFAMLALIACSQPASTAQTAQKPNVAAPYVTQPQAQLTPAMLVGRWGDNGDCTKDIVFDPNGTFRSYTGGQGAWTLNGDVMTMSGAGGTFQVRVEIINGQQLLITNPDGSIGTSQRC